MVKDISDLELDLISGRNKNFKNLKTLEELKTVIKNEGFYIRPNKYEFQKDDFVFQISEDSFYYFEYVKWSDVLSIYYYFVMYDPNNGRCRGLSPIKYIDFT